MYDEATGLNLNFLLFVIFSVFKELVPNFLSIFLLIYYCILFLHTSHIELFGKHIVICLAQRQSDFGLNLYLGIFTVVTF